MQHLNLDLVPEILSFVDEDSTLRSSSLVHRSWTTCSQALLFHTIHVEDRSIVYSWSSPWIRLVILLETTPHLRPYIRILDFHYDIYTDDRRRDAHLGLTLFPNVHTMRFASNPLWHIVENHPRLKSLFVAYRMDNGPLHEDRLHLEQMEIIIPGNHPRLPLWFLRSPSLKLSLRKLSVSFDLGYVWTIPESSVFDNMSLPLMETLEVTFKAPCENNSTAAAQQLIM
jgi:hypothetical protein